MLKIFFLSSTLIFGISLNVFSQTTPKPDPDSQINAEEQVNGMPGASKGGAY
ncbi:MAG: hypothetical protein K2Q18_06390 [Bdellovibrionales bacterium]|nr:hypothetical protein [Bdellovibrionales bacterium]